MSSEERIDGKSARGQNSEFRIQNSGDTRQESLGERSLVQDE
jgi:hypothetical protein